MRHLKSAVVFVAATWGAVSAVLAGAGVIATVVTPLQGNVTYSTDTTPPLATFIGYTVATANEGGNTVNNIRFTAATTVSFAAEKATYSSAEGASCRTTNADRTAIECTIGQLSAGQSRQVAVFFNAPVKAAANNLPQDLVTLTGTTYFAEGTGGINSVPDNSINEWDPVPPVTLGTNNPTNVKSALPKAGGKLFTGLEISTPDDPFTTTVIVPTSATFTTAVINESPFGIGDGCTNFVECYRSDLTIPGTFSPYLTIFLRQNAANIVPGTKIQNVLIYYIDAFNEEHLVGDCASPTTPRTDGLPCIAKRVYYKNRGVSGWTPALDGSFEWMFLSIGNGGYRVP